MRLNFLYSGITLVLILLWFQSLNAQYANHAKIGIASYYHGWLDGKTTANGEKYDESQMTAAHLTLPFNSKVKVTNLYNQKSIIVRINDRGPFITKRIIDLSRAAADSLGFIYNGLTKVQLTVLSYGKPKSNRNDTQIAAVKSIIKPEKIELVETNNIQNIITHPKVKDEISSLKKDIITDNKTNDTISIQFNKTYGLQIGSFKLKKNAVVLSEKMKVICNEEIIIHEIKKGNTSFFRLIIGKFADEKKVIQLKEKLNKDYPESFIIRH